MEDIIELPPSAIKTMNSLRKIGYNLTNAVADIIDNSIEAKATKIEIEVIFEGAESWIRISDNGIGMNKEQLIEAMKYGSDREYSETDLGKFGFGLKTASSSQCKRISVASRSQDIIYAYCWDLDEIAKANKWNLIGLDNSHLDLRLSEPLKKNIGTVVLWEKLDSILGYNSKGFAERRIKTMCREIEEHIGMIFHRYLSGEVADRKVSISINGVPIEPWDPFCRSERATRKFQTVKIPFLHMGKRLSCEIQPYILPHEKEFVSIDGFKKAAGPKRWNAQQGFYIYRSNRMIQSGGWNRLRTSDEHTKLARIAINILPELDDAFEINIAKMKVSLPEQMKDSLDKELKVILKQAKKAYRKHGDIIDDNDSTDDIKQPDVDTEGKDQIVERLEIPVLSDIEIKKGKNLFKFDFIEQELLQLANKQESRVLIKFFKILRKKFFGE